MNISLSGGGLHRRSVAISRSASFARLGGRIARNNLRAHLNGTGIEAVLNGLYLPRLGLIDHHMVASPSHIAKS